MAPRSQPFDESMDSLNTAIRVAQMAGYRILFEKVRRGCPGFQNAGPILAHMLRDDDTHLFIAADDVIFPPDVIVRLVNDDKDVVAGIYRKNVPLRIEPANCTATGDEFVEKFRKGGLHETEYAAGHSMTIKREVIEKMIADYPELAYEDFGTKEIHYALFMPMIVDRKCYQDDWSFSIRAKKSGFKLWDDYSCRLKHYCCEFLGFEALEAANGG